MNILVDMDGVLTDFVTHATKFHGMAITERDYPPEAQFDVVRALNIAREKENLHDLSAREFWQPLDYEFWRWMPQYIFADAFITILEKFGEVYIATSPTLSSEVPAAKHDWVKENYPGLLRKLMIGAAKHLMAKEDAILIDDADKNVDKFRAAGGRAILLPRAWNSGGFSEMNPYDVVIDKLREMV